MDAARKYLRDWAEPETAFAAKIDEAYDRVLVVPARREEPSLFDGYIEAARTSRGRTLCILVVNGSDEAPPAERAEDRRFLEGVLGRLSGARTIGDGVRAHLGAVDSPCLDALVVDRVSDAARVPRKEGVGLARKIGFDLGLGLVASGKVSGRLMYGTDADATLPEAFFDEGASGARSDVAAVLSPFRHEPCEDVAVTAATAFYELSLRYYVAGLSWAGSPYAFHTLGSATAVDADAYAAVRGMPKRQAAEDFYLLNKLAKIGAVVSTSGAPIRLRSRESDRTPFGTGASVSALLAGAAQTLYAPLCFFVVSEMIASLDDFAERGDVLRALSVVERVPMDARASVRALLSDFDAEKSLQDAAREAKSPSLRKKRVHEWFDAFRTLKLVHAVESAGAPKLPWQEALALAPFRVLTGNVADG